MTREEAYEEAASCYGRAGYQWDAARCYRLAGAHRRAAEIFESLGQYAEAVAAFGDAGLPELGAWLLAHHVGAPAAARAMLASMRGEPGIRHRLVTARCEIAEGAPGDVIRPIIADICAVLEDPFKRPELVAENWAVMLSEAAARFDQAALVFAAAVRGGRNDAAGRWDTWSRRVLGTEIILPSSAA